MVLSASASTITVFENPEAVAAGTADFFAKTVTDAVAARGVAHVALSGGNTPKLLFRRLAKMDLPWDSIHFWWGDERFVPASDERSNYHMTRETLLQHVPVPAAHVHRVPTEEPTAAAAAEKYGQELRNVTFDLALLGMGADGHTASLFPGIALPTGKLAAGFHVPAVGMDRVTLLPGLLNRSREILFVVTGLEKKAVAQQVLDGKGGFPAGLIKPEAGRLTWYFDKAAAPEVNRR